VSAGSRECLGCGTGVFWVAGQSPALWCPGCRPSAEEAYEAGMRLLLVNQKRLEVDLAAARIEGAERALLERDVAEVTKAIPSMRAHAMLTLRDGLGVAVEARRQKPGGYREALDREASNTVEAALLFAVEVVDCQAWLARAKAVLG